MINTQKNYMHNKKPEQKPFKKLLQQWDLQLLVIPAVIWMVIFAYVPIVGLQIAFKDFSFSKGMWNSDWIGLQLFKEILSDHLMWNSVKNTIFISLLKLVFAFPMPIIFALMLNELGGGKLKKVIQTVSYFPHFIAWAVVAMMVQQWLSPLTGFVNALLMNTGILKESYHFLGSSDAFWWIVLILEIWKGTGYGAIIYLATISGIDQEQYEAAEIDGASRLNKMHYITLPSILGTIMIMFILNISTIINGNFDISFLLGNTSNHETSEILQTYTYRIGIQMGRFSYAAAVGLISGLISMVLLFTSNKVVNKITGHGFY